MLWKYTLFELKVVSRNRKQWILGLVLILFFPLYFHYYQDTEIATVESQKVEEKSHLIMTLDMVPQTLRDTPEGKEIYDNLTQQLSTINMQIYYVATIPGRQEDEFIEAGMSLNDLRLEMHDKGNPYIPDSFIVPKEEIAKENEFLSYLHDHELIIENNPLVTSQFFVTVVQFLSGILLFAYILLIGSDMLVYENQHRTLLTGLPVSFMTKATSKFGIHYLYMIACLFIGAGLGIYRSSKMEGFGDFSYPVTVYTKSGFEVISTLKYLGYISIALLIMICLVLSLAYFLEIIFQNIYATILAGLALFALPDLLHLIGLKAKFLYPIKYTNITAVLSGKVAQQYGETYIDYWHSILWMSVFTICIISIIFIQNKLSFDRGEIEAK